MFTIVSDLLRVSISPHHLFPLVSFHSFKHGKRPGVCRPLLMILCSLGIGLGLGATTAMAKPKTPPPITITQEVFKTDKSGQRGERLSSSDRGKAGDILIYRTSYRNETKRILSDVVATVPISTGFVFVADSAVPAIVYASKDSVTYFPITVVPGNAPIATWRSLRWAAREIAPLSEFIVEHRVRVLDASEK